MCALQIAPMESDDRAACEVFFLDGATGSDGSHESP